MQAWYETKIDSHDEDDCPGESCRARVVEPGDNDYSLRERWMETERVRRGYTAEDRAELIKGKANRLVNAERDLQREVEEARLAGLTWEQVGQALGITAGTASRRFASRYPYP